MGNDVKNPHAGQPWTRLNVNCGTHVHNYLFHGVFAGTKCAHSAVVNTFLQALTDELHRLNLSPTFDSGPAAAAVVGRLNFRDLQAIERELAVARDELDVLRAAVNKAVSRQATARTPVRKPKPSTRRRDVAGGTPKVRVGTSPDGVESADASGQA